MAMSWRWWMRKGNVAASYAYDAFGVLTSASESFGSGTTWTNPYRYDGRDGVRYDGETGLYWMSVRSYDPALGRFLSRDPLGRSPLFSDQPYVYAANNPLVNTDPSGQATGWQTRQESNCLGKQHCVIFIPGIDVTWPWARHEDSLQADKDFWGTWHDDLNSAFKYNVGFIYFEAPDAPTGAYRLNIVLQRLNRLGYKGRISVAAESNGAAALFMYLAGSALGIYSTERVISRFVALDAPVGAISAISIVFKAMWSWWHPYLTMYFASQYVWDHGTRGVYAFNVYDIASTPVYGAWSTRFYWYWAWFDVAAAHNWLATSHQPALIAAML